MNWEAIGAIGEVVGAIAVVTTLIILLIQVRQNTQSMIESNRLQKAAAIDKHADSMGLWRSHLINNRELMALWIAARNNEEIDAIDTARFDNIWVNLVNAQRSNFVRAKVVGEDGLAQQAVKSIAIEMNSSPKFEQAWSLTRNWHQLASPDFVSAVEEEFEEIKKEGAESFVSGIYSSSLSPLKNDEN